jgi:hypothetical protein
MYSTRLIENISCVRLKFIIFLDYIVTTYYKPAKFINTYVEIKCQLESTDVF